MEKMKIREREWKRYFETVNAELRCKPVPVDSDSLATDERLQSGWVELNELSYDPEFDICRLSVSGQVLQFKRLQDIHLTCSSTGISTIDIKGTDGVRHVVRFRRPLPLVLPAFAALEAV